MLTQGKGLKAGTLLFLSTKEIRFVPWPREKARRAKKPAPRAGKAKKAGRR